jgi:hypothetical protein
VSNNGSGAGIGNSGGGGATLLPTDVTPEKDGPNEEDTLEGVAIGVGVGAALLVLIFMSVR